MKNRFFKFIRKIIGNYLAFIFLLVIFISSTYYLYQHSFFYIHDYTIGAKIFEMTESLRSWHLPSRWSANFGYGFGMPLFNFYAPLPYFIGALFHLIGFELTTTIKLLYLLLTFISMMGSFKLGKKLFGFSGGIILAAAFTLAPYRALNLFVRGALSEAFAISFFPWVILALYRIKDFQKTNKEKSRKAYLLLFGSILAIILSHNLSALMFIPLAIIWAIFVIGIKDIKNTAFVFFLAAMASAFYVVPAFLEKDLTKIDSIFSGYFDYRNHFLYIRQFFQDNWGYGGSAWGTEDDISFFLGLGQISSLFLGALVFAYTFIKKLASKNLKNLFREKRVHLFIISAISLGLALFLSIEKSHFIWAKISLLPYIQFPWRWLGAASFFLAIFAAASINLIDKNKLRWATTFVLLTIILFNLQFFKAKETIDNPELFYYTEKNRIRSEMSETLPDYIPLQMANEEILHEYNQLYPEAAVWAEHEIEAQLIKEKVNYQKWQINSTQSGIINFKIANFPGWTAKINQEEVSVLENSSLGNIQLLVPAGDNELELKLKENRLRLISNLISLGAVISIAIFLSNSKNK